MIMREEWSSALTCVPRGLDRFNLGFFATIYGWEMSGISGIRIGTIG